MNACLNCGQPASGGLRCLVCFEAWKAAGRPRSRSKAPPLPAREPDPQSWRFCRCGALSRLVLTDAARDEWRCRGCLEAAA